MGWGQSVWNEEGGRKPGLHAGAPAAVALDAELTTEQHGALAHADGAQANGSGRVGVEPATIVADRYAELGIRLGSDDDAGVAGKAVEPNIRQGFFDDAVEVQRGGRRQRLRPSWLQVELRLDTRLLGKPGNQRTQRFREAAAEGVLASQVVQQLANAAQHLAGRALDRIELLQHVLPADLFRLEVLHLDEHARERLRDPVVQ